MKVQKLMQGANGIAQWLEALATLQGQKFNSQLPQGSSTLSATPISKDLMPSDGLQRGTRHMYNERQQNTHIHKK